MARTAALTGHDHRGIQLAKPPWSVHSLGGDAPAVGGTVLMFRRAARRGAARHNHLQDVLDPR